MQILLLSIHPNVLETLIIVTDDVNDLIESTEIQHTLELEETSRQLADLLQHHAILKHALLPKYPFKIRQLADGVAYYNPAVYVSEIYQQLESFELSPLKEKSQFEPRYTAKNLPMTGEKEPELLTAAFSQLQEFYYLAAEHNLAVIAVVGEVLYHKKFL